jgi:hypothetical protein
LPHLIDGDHDRAAKREVRDKIGFTGNVLDLTAPGLIALALAFRVPEPMEWLFEKRFERSSAIRRDVAVNDQVRISLK